MIADWTAIAVLVGLVINATVVAFSYGSLTQRVKQLESKINKTDTVADTDRGNFNVVRDAMMEIKGNLATLIRLAEKPKMD